MIQSTLINSTIAITITSSISIVGAITIAFIKKHMFFLKFMIAFAVGALLGDVFIHMLPEMQNTSMALSSQSFLVLFGLLTFFIIEKLIHWHHCHQIQDKPPILNTRQKHNDIALINLIGDGIHNLIDGIVITASFLSNHQIGIATTIAVILHEIPQELSDFSILIHSGLSSQKALVYNFLSGLTSFIGMLLFFLLNDTSHQIIEAMVPITAGGFLYIATADLIPELHKHTEKSDLIIQTLGIGAGLLIMECLKFLS